jgi:pimeloyl-ACP methyl ester carboxylesterase
MPLAIPLVSGLALVAAAVWVETRQAQADLASHPPPGRLVDAGGHRLHIHCTGEGSPVVVLDAGLGDSVAVWATIQEKLATTTRVCSYDRAGLGWSDPGPQPRTYQRAAEELHALLEKAGEKGPFVLVGHSAGVNTVRLFAAAYPEQVAGLALIEPPLLSGASPAMLRAVRLMRQAVGGLSRVGAIRLLGRLSGMRLLFGGVEPPAALAAHAGFLYRPSTIQASVDEIDALPETIRLLERSVSPGAWRAWPVTIVAAARGGALPPQVGASLEALAGLSTRGKLVRVKGGHFVHFEHPERVVEAIEEVVAGARQ